MGMALGASLFVFLAILTLAIAVFRRGPAGGRGPDARVRGLRAAAAADDGQAVGPSLRRSYSSIPFVRRVLSGSTWAESAAEDLRRANVQLRVGEYLLIRLFLGFLALVIVGLIMRFSAVGLVLAVAVGGLVYLVPPFFLHTLHRRRVSQIEMQLVELSPLLASALRSGFGLGQGIELAAKQLEPPLADELQLLIHDVNLGAPMDQALLDMGRRIDSPDMDMLITAIMVQRTTGGNLAEILDQSAETLRERERIRGELNTLTAHQRLSGIILSIYPIAVGLLLLLIMPSMWSIMFRENAGRILLGVALGLQGIGFLVMRRIMNIRI